MGKSKSYIINGELFGSKTLLQERIKSILYGNKIGYFLNNEDFNFMLAVLQGHPESDMKIGVGVKGIFVDQNPLYKNTRCFWLVRQDNSQTDFSYIECLKETSEQRKFSNACRAAIEPYTQKFKKEFFSSNADNEPYYCPYTHEEIYYLNSHVHHKFPKTFTRLVHDFIDQYKIDVSQIPIITGSVDNSYQDLFEDKVFERLWVDYHNNHAELQIVSSKANLSFPKTPLD